MLAHVHFLDGSVMAALNGASTAARRNQTAHDLVKRAVVPALARLVATAAADAFLGPPLPGQKAPAGIAAAQGALGQQASCEFSVKANLLLRRYGKSTEGEAGERDILAVFNASARALRNAERASPLGCVAHYAGGAGESGPLGVVAGFWGWN